MTYIYKKYICIFSKEKLLKELAQTLPEFQE